LKRAILDRLAALDTPTVANGVERLNTRDPSDGFMGPNIRALLPELGVRAGVAVTARMDTTSPGVDHPPSLFNAWLRLMREASVTSGEQEMPVFAVMEAVGPRVHHTVCIGDGMATVMRLAGCTGFLTNGSIRDIEGVRGVGLACWGYGVAAMHGRMRWLDVGSPVCIDGISVRTGDIVHADANGAIIIPPGLIEQVLAEAEGVRASEAEIFAWLRAPGRTLDEYLAKYPD
jgi:regulator of RNase E activity RraA